MRNSGCCPRKKTPVRFPLEKKVAFPKESQLDWSRASQPTDYSLRLVFCVCLFCTILPDVFSAAMGIFNLQKAGPRGCFCVVSSIGLDPESTRGSKGREGVRRGGGAAEKVTDLTGIQTLIMTV